MIGVLLILIGGAAFSVFAVQTVEKRAQSVKAFCELLRLIKERVECFGMSSGQILHSLDRELLWACGYRGDEPPSNFLELVGECDIADGSAKEILLEFFSEFGKSYRAEQIKRCEYYLDRLSKHERLVCSRAADQKKLYATLCLSLSLVLVILLF